MKKKLLVALTAIIAAFSVALGFSACSLFTDSGANGGNKVPDAGYEEPDDDEPDYGEHTHAYDRQEISEEYLKSAEDCTHAAEFYYSCRCGKAGEETFVYGEPAGHKFENGVCRVCKIKERTDGLEYTLSDDGKYYVVSGMGTVTDTDIVIESEYNGLPVTTVGEWAFFEKKITSVVIPEGITVIRDYAFRWCKNLESVTFPDGLVSIGNYAFQSDKLTRLDLPDSVKEIGNFAFHDLAGVTELVIPAGVTEINTGAFGSCGFTSVKIHDKVTSIGLGAFSICLALKEIVIPDSVRTIGLNAFVYSGLESVVLGSGVTSIGEGAFEGCLSLEKIYYKGNAESWSGVTVENKNAPLTEAEIYYYSASLPLGQSNEYWYYGADGKVTVWH